MVGLNARNKNNIAVGFHCLICSLILHDPVQLECGHRQCKSCVESIVGEIILCSQCKKQSAKAKIVLDKGCKNDMQTLPIDCSLCNWSGLLQDYESHLSEVHSHPVCECCGQQFDSSSILNAHQLKECNQVAVPCALKEYGCSELIKRADLANHYMTEQHQKAIMVLVRRFNMKWSNDQSYERQPSMETDIPSDIATTTTSFIDDKWSSQWEETYGTIDMIAGGVQALNDDVQRLSNESLRLRIDTNGLNHDLMALKLSIQEENIFLDGVKPNQEILNQEVASLKQKVEDMQSVSYDGTFVWKITSFKEKMTDAQSERRTSIYSPPFYSSSIGYKMRARLYLYGDGNARRTHMSLFFVIMRSEYDEILKFPFNYKVTFCLYDQTPNQKHIIDSFRPDIKSNSFQRPRSDMNIASGIPKFFPLTVIQQEGNPYVRDDTMFIKIMVDFAEIPKTLLPYALTLNPGLPVHIQQSMVKEEIERRAQQAAPPPTNPIPQPNVKQN